MPKNFIINLRGTNRDERHASSLAVYFRRRVMIDKIVAMIKKIIMPQNAGGISADDDVDEVKFDVGVAVAD